jgi:biopolymer transport protein ExbB
VEPAQAVGFAHFLGQTDAVGRAILVILLGMSLASWYLIITKSLAVWLERRRSGRFLEAFWNAPSIAAVHDRLERQAADESFSQLTWHAIVSQRHHKQHGARNLSAAASETDFLTRAMRRAIDEDTARLESGLTVLASIGSTAPFVGLFGTVWGIYHALVAISMSGQGTLDKVAGPVGEALIMTALGLAVAIPAVLAYNAFVRSNRLVLARLDAFAHDLYAVLTTGGHVGEGDTVVTLKPAISGKGT